MASSFVLCFINSLRRRCAFTIGSSISSSSRSSREEEEMAAVAAVAGGKRRGAAGLSIDDGAEETAEERVGRLIRENPAVIFSRRGCYMSHVMKRLLAAVGAHPAVVELEEGTEEAAAVAAGGAGLPALFLGGVAVGGLEGLMALHLRNRLVPMLLEAGALIC